MRVLLDTHAFLWIVGANDRLLSATARGLIEAADERWLSLASVWEAEMKRAAGRLNTPPVAAAAGRLGIPLLPITAQHATTAAHLPFHHRDPFDRLLVAQAQLEGLVLVSKDAAMRRYGIAVAW